MGCVLFNKNVAPKKKKKEKKSKLEKMSFPLAFVVLSAPPTSLRLLLYLRNAKQQGATEDLQITVS